MKENFYDSQTIIQSKGRNVFIMYITHTQAHLYTIYMIYIVVPFIHGIYVPRPSAND